MAVQALHGLVREKRHQSLTTPYSPGARDQAEVDLLVAQIEEARLRLRIARDIVQVGELLALIYRCEDRIKAIRRTSRRR